MAIRRMTSRGGEAAAVALCAVFASLSLAAQTTAPSPSGPEVTSHSSEPDFKLRVERNVVLVRVTVLDAKGQPVAGLTKDDFRLFDNRKPQIITRFSVEVGAGPAENAAPAVKATPQGASVAGAPPPAEPRRFLAMYFDDVNMKFEDVARTRRAAEHFLASALGPGDRVGVFTSSGQGILDFTDDRNASEHALRLLQPRPVVVHDVHECPRLSPYQAYLIVHRRDPFAMQEASAEAYHCYCQVVALTAAQAANCAETAERLAQAAAFQVMNNSEDDSEYALRGLRRLLRRMALVRGERNVILISPGFLTLTQRTEVDDLSDYALRSNIVISTFDSKGLYAPLPLGDASKRPIIVPERPDLMGHKAQINLDGLDREAEVLRDVAYDTGGFYFHNSNDYDGGFRQAASFPTVAYLLAFSPENLKLNGSFHTLKVSVPGRPGVSMTARRGYYAPTKALDSAALAREELKQAVLSQEEMNEIPMQVRTQFFKIDDTNAKLSVLIHLDMTAVRFHKQGDRNSDKLTVVTALFDNAGTYVTGEEKQIDFHLRDATLEKLLQTGIGMRTNFDVKAGTYTVRQVVKDGDSGQMSAHSRTIEIP